MTKLTKAQRDQILMVIFGTAAAIVALWYFVVMERQNTLIQTRLKCTQMQDKVAKAKELLSRTAQINENLQVHSNELNQIESSLAPDRAGYEWVIEKVNVFVAKWEAQATTPPHVPANLNTNLVREIHITSYSPPEMSDKGFIPKFPYRWATFRVKGIAYFHDFGKFVSDFENSFPYFRIQNLDIAPTSGVNAEPEKLNFNFDLVAPVQPAGQVAK
jgi:hypothetical protein